MSETPTFPPLLIGEETRPEQQPFNKAIAAASLGTDAGLICWQRRDDRLEAAIVFAPEEPLADAMTVVLAVALGLGDALGALAPPEVAIHYVWPNGFKVNGADCGRLRAAASTTDPDALPDWLVVGVEVPFRFDDDEPGRNPQKTCLIEEGCGEVTPHRLLESWSRHMLTWINRREHDGISPLHAEWRSRAWGIGEPLDEGAAYGPGNFMGLDERAGMLVKNGDTTRIVPLTEMLE
ncbi:DUF4444 domain-containing protein [Rhodobacteraceae bacterium NNCM2]|nr:DUF4444 domain-containing protein [Coraliihabitans acroporae]